MIGGQYMLKLNHHSTARLEDLRDFFIVSFVIGKICKRLIVFFKSKQLDYRIIDSMPIPIW